MEKHTEQELELIALEEKYPGGRALYVEEVDELLFLRKIDRGTYTAAMKWINNGDALTGAETILAACTVYGDFKTVTKDFDALRSTSVALSEFITVKAAVLKKRLTDTE